MSIVFHDDLPIHEVPRIKTRVLVGAASGAKETAVWQQWIEPDGLIPLHYHDVEEVLVFLTGTIALTIDDQTIAIRAPATVVIPAGQIHGLRPADDVDVQLIAFFPCPSPRIIAPDGTIRPMPWDDRQCAESPP